MQQILETSIGDLDRGASFRFVDSSEGPYLEVAVYTDDDTEYNIKRVHLTLSSVGELQDLYAFFRKARGF